MKKKEGKKKTEKHVLKNMFFTTSFCKNQQFLTSVFCNWWAAKTILTNLDKVFVIV